MRERRGKGEGKEDCGVRLVFQQSSRDHDVETSTGLVDGGGVGLQSRRSGLQMEPRDPGHRRQADCFHCP